MLLVFQCATVLFLSLSGSLVSGMLVRITSHAWTLWSGVKEWYMNHIHGQLFTLIKWLYCLNPHSPSYLPIDRLHDIKSILCYVALWHYQLVMTGALCHVMNEPLLDLLIQTTEIHALREPVPLLFTHCLQIWLYFL